MAIEDLRAIGNVLYRVAQDGTLYPVRRMQPDEAGGEPLYSMPPRAEDAFTPTPVQQDTFGDTTMRMAQPYLDDAMANLTAGPRPTYFTDPVMGGMERLGQSATDVGMAGLNTALAGMYGGAGLLGEVFGGNTQNEMRLARDLAAMADSAGPAPEGRMLGLLADAGAARSAGRAIAERANLPGPVPTMYSNPVPGLLGDVGIEDILRAKYPNVKISISGSPKNGYTLSKIEVPKSERSGGVGTAIMRDLTQMADQQGAVLKLSPAGDFGGSVSRLKDFYKRFGFTPNKGRNADYAISESMYRNPKTISIPALPAPRNEAEAIAKNILEQRATGDVSGVTEDMMAAADPQYMYANTPLPMDAASRMARADARGAKSGYRTDKDLFSFRTGQGKQTGIGVTMSNDPAVANSYIGKGDLVYPVYNLGKKGASIDASGSRWNDISPYSEMRLTSGREMQLSDAMPPESNLEDYQLAELEHYLSTGNKLPDSDFGYSTDDVARYLKGRGADYTSFENIVDPGAYSRFKTPEANLPATTTMVADPANVRSRFALFDPMFSHLRNLSAGVAISPLAYGLLSDPTTRERNQ